MGTILKKRGKTIDEWNSLDFVKYFMSCYREKFKEVYQVKYSRDCSIVKRLLMQFMGRGKNNHDVHVFIDWVFAREKTWYDRPTVGISLKIVEDYFREKKMKPKKIEFPEVDEKALTKDMQEWLERERAKWKSGELKF